MNRNSGLAELTMPGTETGKVTATPRLLVLGAVLAGMLSSFVFGILPQAHGSEPVPGKIGSSTPVVVILLDELPTASLLGADGQRISKTRFPHMAAFAERSTWYRDHAAAGDFTAWAVPPILSGELGSRRLFPTIEAFPNNLFSLFGPGRRINVLEAVTEMCPINLCPGLKRMDATGIKFSNDFIKAKFKPFDLTEVNRWIRRIPAGQDSLSFIHLKVPHLPYRFTPDGRAYPGGALWMPTELKIKNWVASEAAISFVQQRQLWQVGFADRLVGQILDKIRSNGDFRDAMVVLTADHGVSFDPKDLRRDATPTNLGAIANPPMMIKYPGQTKGTISTASTQAIDILPTIAKTLGASIPSTSGLPVDEVPAERQMTVIKDRNESVQITAQQIRETRRKAVAMQTKRFGNRDLWRLGTNKKLFGRKPGQVPTLPTVRATFDNPAMIRRADAADSTVPALVSGTLQSVGPNKLLAMSWNGRIVATTRTFLYKKKIRFGLMVPPKFMRKNRNKVSLYLVGSGDRLSRIDSGLSPKPTKRR